MNSHSGNQPKSDPPPDLVKKAIALYHLFDQKLSLPPRTRATGIAYFRKHYQLSGGDTSISGIYAISSLHLATKVCETAVSINTFITVITNAKGDERSEMSEIFQTLKGLPDFSSDDFMVSLSQMLLDAERKVIIALNFNFEVRLPYELCGPYTERVMRWHMKVDKVFYKVKEIIVRKCYIVLDELQLDEMFFSNPPETLAVAAITVAFQILRIPLVSPNPDQDWFMFLLPDVNVPLVKKFVSKIEDKFDRIFRETRNANEVQLFFPVKIPPEFNVEQMKHWLSYPLIPMKNRPLCQPPPIHMLDDLCRNDDSYKKTDADHVPLYPPPFEFKLAKTPNLIQFQNECPPVREKKQKNKNRNSNKKGNNKNHLSQQRYSYDDPKEKYNRRNSRFSPPISPHRVSHSMEYERDRKRDSDRNKKRHEYDNVRDRDRNRYDRDRARSSRDNENNRNRNPNEPENERNRSRNDRNNDNSRDKNRNDRGSEINRNRNMNEQDNERIKDTNRSDRDNERNRNRKDRDSDNSRHKNRNDKNRYDRDIEKKRDKNRSNDSRDRNRDRKDKDSDRQKTHNYTDTNRNNTSNNNNNQNINGQRNNNDINA